MPLVALLLSAAAPAAPLTPNGPWLVEAEASSCAFSRAYGAGGNSVRAGMKPAFTAPTMQVFGFSRNTSTGTRTGKAVVTVGTGTPHQATFFSIKARDGDQRITRVTVGRSVMDEFVSGGSLAIEADPVRVNVMLTAVNKARAALDQCERSLLQEWGVDPEALAANRAPKGEPWKFFGTDAYPTDALRAEMQGQVIAILQIAPSGAVTGCRVVVSVGKPLDERTCEISKRMHFQPGTDAAGHPAASQYIMPINWTLPTG